MKRLPRVKISQLTEPIQWVSDMLTLLERQSYHVFTDTTFQPQSWASCHTTPPLFPPLLIFAISGCWMQQWVYTLTHTGSFCTRVCVSAHAYAHQQHTTIKLTLTTHSHSNNFLNDLHEETIPWSASTYCMDKTSHLTVYPASSYPSHTSTAETWYWPKCIVHSR